MEQRTPPRGDPNPGLPAPGSHAGSASPLGVPEVSLFQSWHRGAVALPGLSGEAGETAHLKMWPALGLPSDGGWTDVGRR